MTMHREQIVKRERENQQDATIRCMRCACLMGGVCGAGVIRYTRGSMPVMGRLVQWVEI